MKKSTLIATCLLNSSMVTSLDVGEQIVRRVFDESFHGQDFSKWDTSLSATTAKAIITGVGRAMRINVRAFIADLGFDPDQAIPDSHTSSDEDTTEQVSAPAPVGSLGKRFDGRT